MENRTMVYTSILLPYKSPLLRRSPSPCPSWTSWLDTLLGERGLAYARSTTYPTPKCLFIHRQSLVHVWLPLGAPAERLGMPSSSLANAWLVDGSGLPRRNPRLRLLLPPPTTTEPRPSSSYSDVRATMELNLIRF